MLRGVEDALSSFLWQYRNCAEGTRLLLESMAARHFGEAVRARRRALAWLEEQQELEGNGKKVEWRREVERMYAVYLPNTPLSPIRNGVLA